VISENRPLPDSSGRSSILTGRRRDKWVTGKSVVMEARSTPGDGTHATHSLPHEKSSKFRAWRSDPYRDCWVLEGRDWRQQFLMD